MPHLNLKDIQDLENRLKDLKEDRVIALKKLVELEIRDLKEFKRLLEKQSPNVADKFSLNNFKTGYPKLEDIKDVSDKIGYFERMLADIASRLANGGIGGRPVSAKPKAIPTPAVPNPAPAKRVAVMPGMPAPVVPNPVVARPVVPTPAVARPAVPTPPAAKPAPAPVRPVVEPRMAVNPLMQTTPRQERKLVLELPKGHVKDKAKGLGLVFNKMPGEIARPLPAKPSEEHKDAGERKDADERKVASEPFALHPLIDPNDFQDRESRSLLSKEQLRLFNSEAFRRQHIHKVSKKDPHYGLKRSVIFDESGEGYVLYKTLGKGGTARVKLVQNIRTLQWRACKIFDTFLQPGSTENPRKYMEHEAGILRQFGQSVGMLTRKKMGRAKVAHPDPLYAALGLAVEMDGCLEKDYLIEDLEKGANLLCYIHPETARTNNVAMITDVNERFKVARNVVLDLKTRFLDRNLIHRDVKPQNVMYDPSTGATKFIDLTFVHNLGAQKNYKDTDFGPMTHGFASPEVVENALYSKASDIYALGRTLDWILLTLPKGTLSEWCEFELKSLVRSMTASRVEDRINIEGVLTTLQRIDDVRKNASRKMTV